MIACRRDRDSREEKLQQVEVSATEMHSQVCELQQRFEKERYVQIPAVLEFLPMDADSLPII